MSNNNNLTAEIKASHEDLRRACVESVKQSITRFEKAEISLSGTSNFQGISHRAFGGAGGSSNSTAVMGQWRTFVDEYGAANCCPPSFVPGRSKKWPLPIQDAIQGMAVNTKCGAFPQMSRVWVAVDNRIFLWNYGTDDVTQIPPFPENIVDVHLAEPRKGVFLNTIQYVLVVSTPRELHFVGMTSHDGGDLGSNSPSDLVPLEMSDFVITKTPTTLTRVTSHRRTGRIFCGGADGFLYEVIYSNTESLFRPKLSLVNRSIYFGGTSVVSSVGRAIASFRQTWVRSNSPIVDVVCSDDRSGTIFALCANGRLECWTVEEDDLYSASSIVSSASTTSVTDGESGGPADAGAITFQCFCEHTKAVEAFLQEPGRRQAPGLQGNNNNAVGGADGNAGGSAASAANVIPLVSLHLPAKGVSGFASSSNSAGSSSSGTIIAVDATGARYYYNAAASFSMLTYSQQMELKLARRDAPLRFADGAETGSRPLRCCAVGGETGGAFCAIYESASNDSSNGNNNHDVIIAAGPNLLPFSGNQSPSEVVSMFSHSINSSSQNSRRSSSRSIKVLAVADCPLSYTTETGRFRRQFIVLHNQGISFVSSLRPVDIIHCALLSQGRLQRALFQRIQAVASPADVAYLLIQLMTTSEAPEEMTSGGTVGSSGRLEGPFRTVVFRGNAFAAASPSGGNNNINNSNSAYNNVNESACNAFEETLLERLSKSGAPSPSVNQLAFEILRSMSMPMAMTDSHSNTESNLTVIFSPLSGGIVSAIGQAIMTLYKTAPTAIGSTGTRGDKAKLVKNLTSAGNKLQSILDIMNRMKASTSASSSTPGGLSADASANTIAAVHAQQQQHGGLSNNNTPGLHPSVVAAAAQSNNPIWSPIQDEASTIFVDPSVQVQYDDSAVNQNHARSCGSATLRLVLNNNNNNNNNSNHPYHNGFNVAPPPTQLTAQHGHRLHIARIAYLYKVCDFARQIAYFWKRAIEGVGPSIITQVSTRVGANNISFIEMLTRKSDATLASRTLIRVLLAEERNALVPNVAVWNGLLSDFEKSCPELYNVSDSLESRATLDIQRLARSGTEQFADRAGVDQTLATLAQQANTMWKAGSLEPICWQLHKSGCSVDAVVLLLRAAARLDSTRTNQSCVFAIRAVTEGCLEAGNSAPASFQDKLRCLDTLHALLEDIRRTDDSTFDLFFDSTRTGLSVPPGWSIWEVEPQDRATHMSILAWLSAPRDLVAVSRKLRAHVTGVYGGRSGASSSPYLKEFFELQTKLGGGNNNNNNNNQINTNNYNTSSNVAASLLSPVSVETARYQWYTRRNHAQAISTFVAVSQSDMKHLPLEERLQARIEVLREAKQCAREGGADAAQIERTLSQLTNQKKLLEDLALVSTTSMNDEFKDIMDRVASQVIGAEDLFSIAGTLPNGAGFDVQLRTVASNAVEDVTLWSQIIDRAFERGSLYTPLDAARICLNYHRSPVFPLDVVIMYVEGHLHAQTANTNAAFLLQQQNANNSFSPLRGNPNNSNNNNASNASIAGFNMLTSPNLTFASSANNSSSTGVDLLIDQGVSSKRIFEEYYKLAKLSGNLSSSSVTNSSVNSVIQNASSPTAMKFFLSKVRASQMVLCAAEALKRYVVISRPKPEKKEVMDALETLRKILVADQQQQQQDGATNNSAQQAVYQYAERALSSLVLAFSNESN